MSKTHQPSVHLQAISADAASAVLDGRRPTDVRVAEDYPTEFSAAIAAQVAAGSPLGPYYIHRAGDDVVVGEIGGAFVAPGTAEIGYAITTSCWGRGYATDAVRKLIEKARATGTVERVVAHTPLDRPASGRVLSKAGFEPGGEVEDEHEGVVVRVMRWELRLAADGDDPVR